VANAEVTLWLLARGPLYAQPPIQQTIKSPLGKPLAGRIWKISCHLKDFLVGTVIASVVRLM